MKKFNCFVLTVILMLSCFFTSGCYNSSANHDKGVNTMNQTKTEIEYAQMTNDLSSLPITFVYDDVVYKGFSPEYFKEVSKETSHERNGEITTVTLKKDNMTFTVIMGFYKDYNAYDYTVYFSNNSNSNSKVIRKVNAIDMYFAGDNAHLKGILGDHTNKYAPYDYDLSKKDISFLSTTGRPTHVYFPYFNLETEQGGAMIAIGWGGTWKANFSYNADSKTTHIVGEGTVGLETYLKPGETVRTPLIGIVRYYEKDEEIATNAWRKWIVDCNMPRNSANSDKPVQPMQLTMLAYDTGRPNSDGSISEYDGSWKRSLDAIYNNGLKFDYRWFDAGWYIDPNGNTVEKDWWGTVGTWELDQYKWPGDSFAQSVKYAKEHSTKTMVWFEPERVTNLAGLAKNHNYNREWVLADNGNNNNFLNNLGIKECLDWTANRIITFMDTYGIDLYREDFNLSPGSMWNVGDGYQGKNRKGITENLYVQGHYELWDRIIAYCAKTGKSTFVDSCASGGGRNDLETLRRSVALLRSDGDRTTVDLRLALTTTLNKWIPYVGTTAKESSSELNSGDYNVYAIRASMLPSVYYTCEFYHKQDSIDWALLRQGQEEWQEISPYLLKDFYTLTPYRGITNADEWTAFMYFDPDTNSGVVQAFRQENCTKNSLAVSLKGLNPDCYYTVRDIDGRNSVSKIKGSALMKMLIVKADTPRTAVTLYVEPAI